MKGTNSLTSDVGGFAKVIWDYHHVNQPLTKCDAILVLCSIDLRVAEYGASLFLKGYGDYIIFSGGISTSDNTLKTDWDGPEAEHFAKIAVAMGVPEDKILVENQAQNTGQNITLTHKLLAEHGLQPKSLLLVQKPYMERRTYATFMKQWPGVDIQFHVTSPSIKYEDFFDDNNPKELILNLMVGDLQRIKEYPKVGYQIEQDIPANVWEAYEHLVELGYTKHLIPQQS